MDMTGEYRIPAPRQRVWEALNDPEVLKASIPGCEEIEKVSDTEMNARVRAKVGPVNARFAGTVTLGDMNPPESYTISGEGKGGAAGFAKGGARVSLAEDGADATVLTYTAQANVGGKLAQLGSRLIQSTAKKMADEFFGNFSAQLGGGRAGAAAAPGVTVAAGEAAAPGAGVEPGAAEAAATAAPAPTAPAEPPQAAAAPAVEPTPTAAAAPSPAAAAQTTESAAPPPAAAARPTPAATPAPAVPADDRTARAPAEETAPPPPPRAGPRPSAAPARGATPGGAHAMTGEPPSALREQLTHPLVVVSGAVVVLVILFLIF